jgi:hypothetical protein
MSSLLGRTTQIKRMLRSNIQIYSSIMKPMWCTFHSILLRIKSHYTFRALLAHPQEVLHKQHFVYCVRVMPVGCDTTAVTTAIVAQPTDITRTQYTNCRLFSSSWGWAGNARNRSRLLIPNKIEWKVYHIGFIMLMCYDVRSATHYK